jgi:hypothetical protein
MSAPLEREYRRALRWYPRRWRASNEDVMLGTLLDVAQERGERTPTRSDLRSLRLHGLAARLGFVSRILTPAIRDRVSAIALGTGVALSAWAIVFSLVNARSVDNFTNRFGRGASTTFGPFASLAIILYALWVLAFIAALIGRPRLMRVLLSATLPTAMVARVLSEQLGMNLFPSTTTVLMLEFFALLALLGTARPTARWRLWVGAGAAAAIALVSLVLSGAHALPTVNGYFFFERTFFFESGFFLPQLCTGGAVLAIMCLALHRWRWAAVVTISMLPWFALLFSRNPGDYTVWAVIALAIAATVTFIALRTDGVRLRITLTRD